MNYKIIAAQKRHEELVKSIYKQEKKHLGSFNLYQCWDKYLSKENNNKFWVIDNVGFVRFAFSKKYNSFILHDIGIIAQQKRKGYGKIFLDKLPRPLILKCNADNDKGNAFYKNYGMNKMGNTQTKKGEPQIVWSI